MCFSSLLLLKNVDLFFASVTAVTAAKCLFSNIRSYNTSISNSNSDAVIKNEKKKFINNISNSNFLLSDAFKSTLPSHFVKIAVDLQQKSAVAYSNANSNANANVEEKAKLQRIAFQAYQDSQKAIKDYLSVLHRPIVFAGPSGAGKSTLLKMLMKDYPYRFGFSVSHTTRQPREGEVDAVHYHFTTVPAMKKEIEEKKFIEHAIVHGNMYGTSVSAVQSVVDKGRSCILDIDVQGCQSVKKTDLNALFIFIHPPSQEELEKRLKSRGEKPDIIVTRMKTAVSELTFASENPNFFDFHLMNDDLQIAYKELVAFLLKNEVIP